MPKNEAKVWNTYGYVRLSREDGDKEESDSIRGQRELIRDYISRHPDLKECGIKVDDGYSGANFDRPGFQEMMADIKAGKVNCIVVKDLSRFGRDHLDGGEYIERIFPFLGVRFIAINDSYDSLHSNPDADGLMIPFKNLVNETYCRDASMKTRSHLDVKRRHGDFVGAFTVYGYQKDPEDRNRLVVDEYAASVVRDIFRWKLEGVSSIDIADRLTAAGILTPMEYKISLGQRYTTKFRKKGDPVWNATMVLRILKNPVYIGTLEQGRVTTPNYKVKRVVSKPRSEWAIVEDNHEPVISRSDFEIVQRVLALDTRTCANGQSVELFSGLVNCGECGAAMVRKTIPSGGKKYVYYVCSAHKNQKICFPHTVRDTALEEIVLSVVKQRIRDVCDLSAVVNTSSAMLLQQTAVQRIRKRMDKKQTELDRCQSLLCSLYENLSDGVIDRTEYQDLKKNYTRRRAEIETQLEALKDEMDRELSGASATGDWMRQFQKYRNLSQLDRAAVVTLIERILIYRERRIEIVFRWQNEYQWLVKLFSQQMSPQREAI